jgi:hypothetical protein
MAKEVLYRVIYGITNPDKDPVFSILAKTLDISDALLHNHSRRHSMLFVSLSLLPLAYRTVYLKAKVKGVDYPGMIPQKGYTVRGTYVTGLTDANIHRLDIFEGSQYSREKVKVLVGSELVEAETYIFIEGLKYLEDREWDYDEFRQNKMHAWTASSSEYNGKYAEGT